MSYLTMAVAIYTFQPCTTLRRYVVSLRLLDPACTTMIDAKSGPRLFHRMGDFRDLRAWQEAKTLIKLSKPLMLRLPTYERYALADQWRRAVYSVALNIAEGATRRGAKEFRRYLDIARGSLHELEAIFEILVVMDYFNEAELQPITKSRDECAKMVYGLLGSMGG